jgi:hypothetical protein
MQRTCVSGCSPEHSLELPIAAPLALLEPVLSRHFVTKRCSTRGGLALQSLRPFTCCASALLHGSSSVARARVEKSTLPK